MAVLHHHRLVPGQSVGDAVLTFTVGRLKGDERTVNKRDTVGKSTVYLLTGNIFIKAGEENNQTAFLYDGGFLCFCVLKVSES